MVPDDCAQLEVAKPNMQETNNPKSASLRKFICISPLPLWGMRSHGDQGGRPKWAGTPKPRFGPGASVCRSKENSAYAAGGARGAVCEKMGPVARTMSSANSREAIGLSDETDGATSS